MHTVIIGMHIQIVQYIGFGIEHTRTKIIVLEDKRRSVGSGIDNAFEGEFPKGLGLVEGGAVGYVILDGDGTD